MKEHGLIDPAHLGVRTKKLKEILLGKLADKDPNMAGKKIDALIAAAGLKLKEGDKTEYLLFLGDAEIAAMADIINQRWDDLVVPESASSGEKKSKKEGKASVPPDIAKAVKALLDGGKAVDVACSAECWLICRQPIRTPRVRWLMPSAPTVWTVTLTTSLLWIEVYCQP